MVSSIKSDQYLHRKVNHKQYQHGFTLIEVMITVAILAIMASIALPSYQSYLIKSREAKLKNQLLSLSIELEQWRAKALSYSGFVPQLGYGDVAGSLDYPVDDPEYMITIGQQVVTAGAVNVVTLNDAEVRGNSWVMMASPKNNKLKKRYFKLNSQGLRCVNNVAFDIADKDCGKGQMSW